MKKFEITIEEHIVQTFDIEAADMDEAFKIAQQKYKAGEITLCPGEVHTTLMSGYEPDTSEGTDWFEFK